ncbi:transglutaminase domain-containing protein [bacterium]|nr:transglutaminase domain-containing protein [bacterium]
MKNLLGFFLLTLLLFNLPLAFSDRALAAEQLTSTGRIEYAYEKGRFNTVLTIDLKNKSREPAVLNYYTILLPYQGIQNLKLKNQPTSAKLTSHLQRNGTELIINFGTKVIPPRDNFEFDITFESLSGFDKSGGFAKVIGKIPGLDVTKVTLIYPSDDPAVSWSEGAQTKRTNYSYNSYEFTRITGQEISILFGTPPTYKYEFNKIYLNESEEPVIHELTLPFTDSEQQFVISSISPQPITQRLDNDENIVLGFIVNPKGQEAVNISGYIIKKDLSNDETYQESDLLTQGYWNLTNEFELIRVKGFLENKPEFKPEDLNTYVVEKLSLAPKSTLTADTSFESALRGGADVAIGRKVFAVPEDYVDLLIALLRNASIPARMVVGYIPKASVYTQEGFYHSWVEYYNFDTKQWTLLDPSLEDMHSKGAVEPNSPNYLKLLIRSSNPTHPKLPFLSKNDLVITPVATTVDANFDVVSFDRSMENRGNVPVIVKAGTVNELILPGQTRSFPSQTSLEVFTLLGDKKVLNFENQIAGISDKTQVLSELLLFLGFLALLFLLNIFYVRINKKWFRIMR